MRRTARVTPLGAAPTSCRVRMRLSAIHAAPTPPIPGENQGGAPLIRLSLPHWAQHYSPDLPLSHLGEGWIEGDLDLVLLEFPILRPNKITSTHRRRRLKATDN